jgi:methyl-accepting chemotaxis protein
MFKNLKIGVKLAIGFGLVVALLLMISTVSVLRLTDVDDKIDLIVNDRYPKAVLAYKIMDIVNEDARALRNIVISNDRAEMTKQKGRIDSNRKVVGEYYETLQKTILSEEGKAKLKILLDSRAVYVEERDKTMELAMNDHKEEAIAHIFGELRKDQEPYFKALDDLVEFQSNLMTEDGREAGRLAEGARLLVIALMSVATLVALLSAWLVTRSVTRPIMQAVAAANRLAEGDLTVSVESDSKDETGRLLAALRDMIAKLTQTISEVRSAAENLTSASGQISATSQSLSQASSEQAASVEETSASMEQMSASVNQNADNAKQIGRASCRERVS